MATTKAIYIHSQKCKTDASDQDQLQISIRGVNDNSDGITELISMEAMKGTTGGQWLKGNKFWTT